MCLSFSPCLLSQPIVDVLCLRPLNVFGVEPCSKFCKGNVRPAALRPSPLCPPPWIPLRALVSPRSSPPPLRHTAVVALILTSVRQHPAVPGQVVSDYRSKLVRCGVGHPEEVAAVEAAQEARVRGRSDHEQEIAADQAFSDKFAQKAQAKAEGGPSSSSSRQPL